MSTLKQIGFHEATVCRFRKRDADIELELEDVSIDGRKSRVFLLVSSVSGVMVDGEPSRGPLMETSDGEVLSLELSETEFLLIVEWNDFSHGKSFTRSYRAEGERVSLSVI